MKTLLKTSFLLLTFLFLSCSKDEANADTPLGGTPQNVTFTKTEKIVSAPIRNISSYWWAAIEQSTLKNNFYIHNSSNTADNAAKGMMFYNMATNTFTDKAKSDNVAAAGYMNTLVMGNGVMYYIANEFNTYDIATNTWTSSSRGSTIFPLTAGDNHGESKSCAIRRVGKIFFVGGRNSCKTVKYFQWTTNTWNFAADYPIAISNGPEVVTDFTNLYALGGYDGAKNSKKFFKYDVASNIWTSLPEAPVEPMQSYSKNSMVYFKKCVIYLGQDKLLHIFNTETSKWQADAIDPTISVNASGWIDAHMEASSESATEQRFYILYRKANSTLGIQEYQ